MPKLKTHKSSRKRIVRVTTRGKVMLRKMSVAHRARFKSKRSKRQSGHNQIATAGVAKRIKRLINAQG